MIPTMTMIAALAAGKPFLTAGTYHYVASLAGQPAGTSTLTVTRNGDQTTIAETSSGSLGAMQLAGKATLELGSDLSPSEYSGAYQNAKQSLNVTVALTPASATVISSMAGGQPQTVALVPNTTHFTVIEPGLLAGLFALPAQMEMWKNAPVTLITPAFAHAQALDVSASSPSPRPSGVPSGDEAISVSAPVAFTIWYDPGTFVPDEIDVPSQDATVVRVRQP
jgi:hypothetical protein